MPSSSSSARRDTAENTPSKVHLTPAENLEYSIELIESLQKISAKQGHQVLARLLGLAAQEATSILRGGR